MLKRKENSPQELGIQSRSQGLDQKAEQETRKGLQPTAQ
jgi:hypothetical protein